MLKTFRKGGIHPPEDKLTAGLPIINVPVPEELFILTSQCLGKPSTPVVKAGDRVARGEMIAEAGGFVGAPIHSPVNGIVKKIEKIRNPQGLWQDAVIITPDEQTPLEFNKSPRTNEEIDSLTPSELISIIAGAGIVGLGGATFPTHVKLRVPEGKKAKYLLINGAECEPFLTCDDALMRVNATEIILGASILQKALGAPKVIIGIEENKPEAIESISFAIKDKTCFSVVRLKKKYPQGSEKQLIQALTGRVVPAGMLPIDIGCVVDNVATAFSVYNAVYNQLPLVERIITVTGFNLDRPGNFRVLNGTPLSSLLEFAGGIPENTGKIIAGGPMMGRAVSNLASGATKGLSGLVVLPLKDSLRKKTERCIRCSACINACPMGLEPYLFMQLAENNYWDDMKSHGVMNCIECGCCSYSCPSSRPLIDMIRLGKNELRKNR